MTDLESRIAAMLADKSEPIDPTWISDLAREHPTFTVPVALYLRQHREALPPQETKRLQASAMLGCADRTAMSDLADLSGSNWADFYPKAPAKKEKGTVETIDKFLETYCRTNEADDALIERLIFNPVAADYLQSGATAPDYPLEEPATEPQPAADEEETVALPADAAVDTGGSLMPEPSREEPSLMESLAKIYIKQRRYERAFEIISNLSLNYPEKSVYFADQLRFLQKLIALHGLKAGRDGESKG